MHSDKDVEHFYASGAQPEYLGPYPSQYVILPQDIQSRCALSYTNRALAPMEGNPPPHHKHRSVDCPELLLVPHPPQPMVVGQIRDQFPDFFRLRTGGWYDRFGYDCMKPHEFAVNETVGPKPDGSIGWLTIGEKSYPGTCGLSLEKQLQRLPPYFTIPTAAEMLWVMVAAQLVRGQTTEGAMRYWRTRSMDSDGDNVCVGRDEDGKLHLRLTRDYVSDPNIGLAFQIRQG